MKEFINFMQTDIAKEHLLTSDIEVYRIIV